MKFANRWTKDRKSCEPTSPPSPSTASTVFAESVLTDESSDADEAISPWPVQASIHTPVQAINEPAVVDSYALSDKMVLRRLDSVLGPGGKLMSDVDYTAKFGVVHGNAPYGDMVWQGMSEWYSQKYVMAQRKAWHLEGYQMRFGYFKCPKHFSKANAMLPLSHDADYAHEYPAIFFIDPSNPDVVYMVCLKMLLGFMAYWYVHRTRARL